MRGIEGSRSAHQRFESHSARQVSQTGHAHARATANAPTAVMAWVPLSSARPSLAASCSGFKPARRSASLPGSAHAVIERLALADDDQGEMRQGRKIAAGAHGTLFGNDGMHASIEQRGEQVQERGTNTAESFGQYVGAQQEHSAGFRL